MSLQQVSSGFDLELILGKEALRHVMQLLMDVGDLPRSVDDGNGTELNVHAYSNPRRTYTAYPDTQYPLSHDDAFEVTVHDFSADDTNNVYFSFQLYAGLPFDIYVRLKESIPVQDTITNLIAYADRERDEDGKLIKFDIHEYFTFKAALLHGIQHYDHNDDYGGTHDQYKAIVDELNVGLSDFAKSFRKGEQDDLIRQLKAQLDTFELVTLESIAFKAFTDDAIGVYCNINLLDHDSGFVSERGNLAAAQNFLPADAEFAFATASQFIHHLLDTLLIKFVLRYFIQEDIALLTEAEALAIIEGQHFPLDIPDTIITGEKPIKEEEGADAGNDDEEDEDEDEDDIETVPRDTVLNLKIVDTSVSTRQHTFKNKDKQKTRADSIKVTIKGNANLANILHAEENLVVFMTPLERKTDGIDVADVGIDTNLRLDVFRNLVEIFVYTQLSKTFPAVAGRVLSTALKALSLLAMFVVGVINLFIKKPIDEAFSGELAGDFGIDALSWLTLIIKRWDPFYTTRHGLLLERESFYVEDERIFVTGKVHLSRRYEEYLRVYPRELEANQLGIIHHVIYRAESWKSILVNDEYATDREPSEHREDDAESGIYALRHGNSTVDGSTAKRIEQEKLASRIPFSPHCIIPDSRAEKDNYALDAIGLLSWQEEENIREDVKNEWLDAAIDAFLDKVETSLGGDIDDEAREVLRDELRPVFEDNQAYSDYLEDQYENDVYDAIQAPESVRLRIAPELVHGLMTTNIISLAGYQSVNREGTRYIRDIADRSTDDNLLSLPTCKESESVIPEPWIPNL